MLARLVDVLRRSPWMTGTGVVLLLALAGTEVVRWVALERVTDNPDERREAVVSDAFAEIDDRFGAFQGRLRAQAERLASDSVVVNGLETWTDRSERPAALVRRVLDVSIDERTTVEVFSPRPHVLAWNGRRVPLGDAPDDEAFLQRPQTVVVADGDVRRALAVWWPVRVDGRVLGAVRVSQTVQYQPPVRNRHIQDFSLQEQWQQATDASIRVQWERSPSQPSRPHRVLRDPEGDVLGTVSVVPPSSSRIERRTARVYDNLLAGWITLLSAWGIVGLGLWYLRLARRPGTCRLSRARTAAAGRLAVLAAAWVGMRYLLLELDVPGRWLEHLGLFTSLFDPTQLASALGGGVLRSAGDLFLTGLWAVLLAAAGMHLALRYCVRAPSGQALLRHVRTHRPARPSALWFLGTVLVGVAISFGSVLALAYVVQRAVLDSTLDFFSRTGLLPEPLLFVVLCALFLLVVAVLAFGVACTWVGIRLVLRHRPDWPLGFVPLAIVVLYAAATALLYLGADAQALVPFPYPVIVIGMVGIAAVYGLVGRNGGAEALTIRGLLLVLFLVTLLFYPLLHQGMDAQRRERMEEAARSFEAGYDPRALYSTRQVLRAADEELDPVLMGNPSFDPAPVDSVATRLLRRSLLASLTTYEVSLSVFDDNGTLLRHYKTAGRQPVGAGTSPAVRSAFGNLRRMHDRQLSRGPVVDRLAGGQRGQRTGRSGYGGLLFVQREDRAGYWVLVRSEPRTLLPGTGPGVPRVLMSNGSFSDLYAELSLAEFRDGRIVRQFGQHFGRTRLAPGYEEVLSQEGELWRSETVRDNQYLTYYSRSAPDDASSTVGVRIPALLAFDHLYYLLRLTVVGLVVGMVVYLLGLYGRYRHGLVPAQRVRFRNKVLNAFLIVGLVSMVAMGVVGVRVVTGESERVVERRLRDRLARIEETLALEGRDGEPLWRVARRMSIDSLAARVGLDLRVYEDAELVGTSRPRLVRDGLVDERLPGAVYHELYDEAYRFTVAEGAIGTFRYLVGYQTLVDESGRPRIVVGVPTLAQQEQVAEEQARTLAYLFGALLVLFVLVMLTAVVLASALARPIARLRRGLEAVGEGRLAEALSVNTRDEVGDLVRTFNDMRAQLAESRRKLAQQEREVAWREMARQVAHEIKNPLTPMKLSIQHLRRAFKQVEVDEADATFPDLFDRITTTLVEQIEALVRIADEFSTFARLPTRVLETLDLNEVVREAVRLMEQETDAETLALNLFDDPLPVEADREELRRTYINLIKNALQAIPDAREGRVRVSTTLVDDQNGPVVESQVVDNGTGIPPDVQDKMFEPNFSTRTGGTGLGLAIAQKTIDDLEGTIEYETSEGEGTTFWVRLPLADEDGDDER